MNQQTKVKTNVVFGHLQGSERIIVEQGGTRSGKTYNILLWIIFGYTPRNKNKTITIFRKTFAALRTSAYRDFISILNEYGIYREENHNKSSAEYMLNGNLIEFVGVDQPQKLRGRKRDLSFLNEANELGLHDWRQISMRTRERFILDYNPSMTKHWIYSEIIPRKDCAFFKTTYRDNPFLDPEIVREIELLRDSDPFYWRVYGEGEIAERPDGIFRYTICKAVPEEATLMGYGLDWGFSVDRTALVAVYKWNDQLYIEQLLYRIGMTNPEIGQELKILCRPNTWIVADSSEPKSVEEIKRMGIKIKSVRGKDTALSIDILHRFKLNVVAGSLDLESELTDYRWQTDRDGNRINSPVDGNDHLIDALRYAALEFLYQSNKGKYAVR